MSGWQPIETAPQEVPLVGLRKFPGAWQPTFIGEVYDLHKGCLIDRWTGDFVPCTHWMPLPDAPTPSPAHVS